MRLCSFFRQTQKTLPSTIKVAGAGRKAAAGGGPDVEAQQKGDPEVALGLASSTAMLQFGYCAMSQLADYCATVTALRLPQVAVCCAPAAAQLLNCSNVWVNAFVPV